MEETTLRRLGSFAIVAVLTGGISIQTSAQVPWTPPIGIPVPSFGIAEVAPALPSPWTTETSGFYYVGGGSDSRGYGTPAAPRATIPSPLPAGSVVVLAGTYAVNHESNRIEPQGTASQPVWIVGASPRPTVTEKWIVIGSHYMIENIDFAWANSSRNGKLILAGSHGVVRNCDLRGDTNEGVGGLVPYGSSIVVWKNHIHDSGDLNAIYDQDNHGISVGEDTSYLWIVDNEIARNSGDGVQINAGSVEAQARTHHIYVGRNKAHHNKQSGLWTKQATDVIFSENEVYGHKASRSSYGQGTGFQYAPSYVWFLYNNVHDNEFGIALSSNSDLGNGTESFFVGNVITNTHAPGYSAANAWSGGAFMFAGGVNRYLTKNKVSDADVGVNVAGAGRVFAADNEIGSFFFQDPQTTRDLCGSGTVRVAGGPSGDLPACSPGQLEQAADIAARFRARYGIDLPLGGASPPTSAPGPNPPSTSSLPGSPSPGGSCGGARP